MDYANVLSTIIRNVANLWPARIILENEQGIRWFKGRPSKILRPGKLHYFWPAFGHIDKVDITDGTLDIEMLTVDTGDHTYTLDGALKYAVTNARKYLVNLEEDDAAPTLSLIARGCVSDMIRDAGGLEERMYDSIVDEFNAQTKQYGVKGKQFIPGTVTKEPLHVRLID